ncbi:MAG TPA: TetR/AcrR family transcriptional regulator [Chthoniobacterales bacterium]
MPVQSRSAITVDAIYDAAIQVLLAVGAKHTTTIRVAERAGVSVGTLYQYHANIQSLMASVIQRHLANVTNAIESACRANHNKPIKVMVKAFIDAFVEVKTSDVDVSRALYAVFSDLNCRELEERAWDLSTKAVQSMLATATDCKIKDLKIAARMIVAAQMGPIRALLEEADASPKMIEEVRKHLFLLCIGYVKQLGKDEYD